MQRAFTLISDRLDRSYQRRGNAAQRRRCLALEPLECRVLFDSGTTITTDNFVWKLTSVNVAVVGDQTGQTYVTADKRIKNPNAAVGDLTSVMDEASFIGPDFSIIKDWSGMPATLTPGQTFTITGKTVASGAATNSYLRGPEAPALPPENAEAFGDGNYGLEDGFSVKQTQSGDDVTSTNLSGTYTSTITAPTVEDFPFKHMTNFRVKEQANGYALSLDYFDYFYEPVATGPVTRPKPTPKPKPGTLTWTGAGDGANWSDPANWQGASTSRAPIDGDSLVFAQTGTSNPIINNVAELSLKSISFTGAPYTVTGLPITLKGGFSDTAGNIQFGLDTTLAGNAKFDVEVGKVTLNGALQGPGGMTVSGGGQVELAHDSTQKGNTTIEPDGTLILSSNLIGTGSFIVKGGKLSTTASHQYAGTITMNAGSLTINTDLTAPLGLGTLDLSGGSIDGTSAASPPLSTLLTNAITLAGDVSITRQGGVEFAGLMRITRSSQLKPTVGAGVTLSGVTMGDPLDIHGDGDTVIGGTIRNHILLDGRTVLTSMLVGTLAKGSELLIGPNVLATVEILQGPGAIDVLPAPLLGLPGKLVAGVSIPDYNGEVTLSGGTINFPTSVDQSLGTGEFILKAGSLTGNSASLTNDIVVSGLVRTQAASLTFTFAKVKSGAELVTDPSTTLTLDDISGAPLLVQGPGSVHLDGVVSSKVAFAGGTGITGMGPAMSLQIGAVLAPEAQLTIGSLVNAATNQLLGDGEIIVNSGTLVAQTSNVDFHGRIALLHGQITVPNVLSAPLGDGALTLAGGILSGCNGLVLPNPLFLEGAPNLQISSLGDTMEFDGNVTLTHGTTDAAGANGTFLFDGIFVGKAPLTFNLTNSKVEIKGSKPKNVTANPPDGIETF